MRPGWLAALIILFVVLSIFNGVCEMTFATGNPSNVFNSVIEDFTIMTDSSANIWDRVWSGISLLPEGFLLIVKCMLFDYAWFTGGWVYLRFVFLAIVYGVLIALLLATRGTSSS